jgi:hypothetical protein
MKYKIEFQYMRDGFSRPVDEVQEEDLGSETGGYLPIPAVGDTVACKLQGRMRAFKVLTRHFTYVQSDDPQLSLCCVNIVVNDVEEGEMRARLKE